MSPCEFPTASLAVLDDVGDFRNIANKDQDVAFKFFFFFWFGSRPVVVCRIQPGSGGLLPVPRKPINQTKI